MDTNAKILNKILENWIQKHKKGPYNMTKLDSS